MKHPIRPLTLLVAALHLVHMNGRAFAQSSSDNEPPETQSWAPLESCPSPRGGCMLGDTKPQIFSWITAEVTSLPVVTAFTVVTIYNTVASTSRLTTIYNDDFPESFTLPDRNSDGTRVTTVTYTRDGTPVTTVVTYPTPFYDWPDYYEWSGTLSIPEEYTNGTDGLCVIASDSPSRRYLTTDPQATDASISPREDPYGLNYGLGEVIDPVWGQLDRYFPDELPLAQCMETVFADGGPYLGSWDPYWIHGDSSTSYEGEEAVVASETGVYDAPVTETEVDAPVTETEDALVVETPTLPVSTSRTEVAEEGPTGPPDVDTPPPPPPPAPEGDSETSTTSSGTSTVAGGVESQDPPGPTEVDSGGVPNGPRWSLVLFVVGFLCLIR